MSIHARQKWVAAPASRYQLSNKYDKHQILEEFIAATGYHPMYAIQRVNHPPTQKSNRVHRKRGVNYTRAVHRSINSVFSIPMISRI